MLNPIYTWNVYGRTYTSGWKENLLGSFESARGAFDLLDWLRSEPHIAGARIIQGPHSC